MPAAPWQSWPCRSLVSSAGGTALPGRAPSSIRRPPNLLADLPAHRILLLIKRLLLGAGDMAIVESRHGALLLANGGVLAMQLFRLASRDLAFLELMIDAAVLICQPVVDLIPARMIAFPLGLGHRARDRSAHHRTNKNSRSYRTIHIQASCTIMSHIPSMSTFAHCILFLWL